LITKNLQDELIKYLYRGEIMNITVPKLEVLSLFKTLNNPNFQSAIDTYWVVAENGSVKPQSVLWLFCWCFPGGYNTKEQSQIARKIFNIIMDRSFDYVAERIDQDYARKYRYKKNVNILYEFNKMINQQNTY